MHSGVFKGILCFLVALSFFAILVPIASASLDESMPCCAGKTAGHCDSGLAPKKAPPRKSEPMCGLDNSAAADDAITIVAEPLYNESHTSFSRNAKTTSRAAESITLSKACRMECGACTAGSARQQRRERAIPQLLAYHNPSLTTRYKFENPTISFSSIDGWDKTSPRGPPTDLL